MKNENHDLLIGPESLFQSFTVLSAVVWNIGRQTFQVVGSLKNNTIKPIVIKSLIYNAALITQTPPLTRKPIPAITGSATNFWGTSLTLTMPNVAGPSPQNTLFQKTGGTGFDTGRVFLLTAGDIIRPAVIIHPNDTIGYQVHVVYQDIYGVSGDNVEYYGYFDVEAEYLD